MQTGTDEQLLEAIEELDKTADTLAGVKDAVREVMKIWVQTGRVQEREAQSLLHQLHIKPLVRNAYRIRVPLTGSVEVLVVAEDEDEALTMAGDRATRMCEVLAHSGITDANLADLRVNRSAPVHVQAQG